MKRIQLAILSLSSLLFMQCGVQTDIASNYYDDGIYFDPTYASIYMDAEVEDISPDEYYNDTVSDYYNPNDYAFIEEQSGVQGNWYGGMNTGIYGSPYGWNTGINFSFGYYWGDYGMYPGYGFGCPGYGMGMYNPFWPGYGYGYPGYGFGYPYYPPYGYGYGYGYGYPYYGNDYGNFWQGARSPDIVYTGKSGPRGNRNNVGSTSPARSSDWPTKSGKTTLTGTNFSDNQTSKLRTSYQKSQGSRYVSTSKSETPSKKYYQQVSRKSTPKKATSITNTGRSYSKTPTYNNSLQRQTNKVVKRKSSGNTIYRNNSGSNRTYNKSSTKSRTSTPSRTNRSSGASRSSTRSSGGSRSKR